MYVFGSGSVGAEWIRGLGLGFTNPVGPWGVLGLVGFSDVCVGCECGLFV